MIGIFDWLSRCLMVWVWLSVGWLLAPLFDDWWLLIIWSFFFGDCLLLIICWLLFGDCWLLCSIADGLCAAVHTLLRHEGDVWWLVNVDAFYWLLRILFLMLDNCCFLDGCYRMKQSLFWWLMMFDFLCSMVRSAPLSTLLLTKVIVDDRGLLACDYSFRLMIDGCCLFCVLDGELDAAVRTSPHHTGESNDVFTSMFGAASPKYTEEFTLPGRSWSRRSSCSAPATVGEVVQNLHISKDPTQETCARPCTVQVLPGDMSQIMPGARQGIYQIMPGARQGIDLPWEVNI